MKTKTFFTCQQCSYQSPKWVGRCPECENWNSFAEETVAKPAESKRNIKGHARTPQAYDAVLKNLQTKMERLTTGIAEWDTVAGGGIVPGSLNLLGGEPGIGKSTLTLQICEKLSLKGKKVLYISGEESEDQIALRAKRLGLGLKNVSFLSDIHLETIIPTLGKEEPDIAIVDSIQVIYSEVIPSSAGTVSQVRFCTEALMDFAKPKKMPLIIIGHVTKDGNLAGPRVLEHLVDGVFIIEGDRFQEFRMLRAVKNRFGNTNEVGIFEMSEKGLQEVKNPSIRFLEDTKKKAPGVALVCTLEGNRPFIIEVQALTSPTRFGYPRRHASGFDLNRLNLLIAVLERHFKLNLGAQDVYVNVVGGFKIQDPACDLGVCMAILSSFRKKTLPADAVYIGEVGLTGEIRKALHTERRMKEIQKLRLRTSTSFTL